jgi:hypothetical protein
MTEKEFAIGLIVQFLIMGLLIGLIVWLIFFN